MDLFKMLILFQHAITVLTSGFNACYFWQYRSAERKRRLGAAVLTIVSSAMLLESLYFGLLLCRRYEWSALFFLDQRYWFLVTSLACFASVSISVLVLRQIFGGKG